MDMENNIVRELIKDNINSSGFILTSPNSGRVHSVVQNIMQIREEYPNDNIIIIDANGDYSKFIDKCGGENIVLSSGSEKRINIFENVCLNRFNNNLTRRWDKVCFLFPLISIMDNTLLHEDVSEFLIESVKNVFEKNESLHYTPTLEDLYNVMKEKNTDNSIEKRVITVIENIIFGELNIFGSITNVDVANLMSFDISSFSLECRDAAMICVIEYVWSQVVNPQIFENRTWIFIDNINLLFYKGENVQEDVLEYLNYLYKSREESVVFVGITNDLNTSSYQNYINNSLFFNSKLLILKKGG